MRSIVFFLITLSLCAGCKPKPTAATASDNDANQPTAAPASSSLIAHAERLGFAAHLPRDTEGFITTLNVPGHLAALRNTAYFRDVTAYLDDKTPAPSTQSTRLTSKPFPLDAVLSDNVFVVLGKGGNASLVAVRELLDIVEEAQYRSYMAGTTMVKGNDEADASSVGETSAVTNVLSAILSDGTMLSRVEDALQAFEMPPLMIGIKSADPAALLAELFDNEQEEQARSNKLNKVFHVTSECAGSFTLIETTGRAYLGDAMVADLLARLPDEPADQAKALRTGVARVCALVQAKKFCLAYGTVQDHVIIAIGGQHPRLEFVRQPTESLLSRPEFSFLQTHAQRPLVGLSFIEGRVLQALRSRAPLQPIVRGLVSGLSESEVFAKVRPALQPSIDALATAERALHTQQYTSAVGVLWWERGLHLETNGGSEAARLLANQPLKYASLLSDPGVLFGIDMQLQPVVATQTRATFEAFVSLLHNSAQQLIRAGLGGQPVQSMSALAEAQIITPLVALYDSSKSMAKDGLGTEQAWLLDLGGALVPVPGLATDTLKTDAPMLRLIGVLEVKNRNALGIGWAKTNDQLMQTMSANPLLFGQRPMLPESIEQFGMTTYFYPFALPSPDLFPCLSINDRVLLISSAKSLNADTAQHLLHVRPGTERAAMRWRLSLAKLRAVLKTYTPLLPKPKAKGEIKSLNQWLAPFEDLSGKVWAEDNSTRMSIEWNMHDVLKYD